ncbi:hypothetical protein LWI29_030796 [Acer saccharum]|uniref:Uncharacterized protein n=1 Tax=Acer saccharum TaxID=4024 RepID=A0AA39T7R4_ACESA|nr:hypothetical protein LWI29_030796 [Acer saccharum]
MFGELKLKGELDVDSKPKELKEEKRSEVGFEEKEDEIETGLYLEKWVVLVVEVKPNLFSGEAERFLLEDVSQVGDVVLVPIADEDRKQSCAVYLRESVTRNQAKSMNQVQTLMGC